MLVSVFTLKLILQGLMPMRRLFSDKAGATFNENLPSVTVNVRKDCVELVSKVDKGLCMPSRTLSLPVMAR